MSYHNQEDWVHIDDYWKEIEALESQLYPLQEYEKQVLQDSAYVLSEIIKARDLLAQGSVSSALDALNRLINLHNDDEKEQANKNLLEENYEH